jgi:hypothetical protein
MEEDGESVLNSAMAAYILPLWAAATKRLGDADMSDEAIRVAGTCRDVVAAEWNGHWFHRARCGDVVVGGDRLFLEVQPWALLCGAADEDRARRLIATIDERLRRGSPLGARQQWPVPQPGDMIFDRGECLAGGNWFALSSILVWAASRYDIDLAWDEFNRMSLASHTDAYPEVWEGTLSGPDSYNSPESTRPGRTFMFGQSFPVNNSHSHAQPLLAYLRLLGVEPSAEGELNIRGGATFESKVLKVREDGHGSLSPVGRVAVRSPWGSAVGGAPRLGW